MPEQTDKTFTLKTRRGPEVVFRLAKGRYLSGCRRFLIEDRDLEGEVELYQHRGYTRRPVSLRRRAKGWAVYDLEHGYVGYDPERRQEVVRAPLQVWLSGYPETLVRAVETLTEARKLVARHLANGSALAVTPLQPGEERVEERVEDLLPV